MGLIIKRLKTGCQWRELSISSYFPKQKISWQTIYYYFHKWSRDGSFQNVWISLLLQNKRKLDLSNVQLDGSHTRCRMGGESSGYQGRKSAKTSNMIFLCDNQGQMLSMSNPRSGNHHDLHDIERVMNEIITLLTQADIPQEGLFLNADAGFDGEIIRNFLERKEIIANIKVNARNSKNKDNDYYFDEELYQNRVKIERSNAWLDGFKSLLIRFETKNHTWKSLHFLAFSILFLRKLKV